MVSHRFCKCVSAALCLVVPTAVRSQQKDDSANLVLAHRLLQVMHSDERMLATVEPMMKVARSSNTQMNPVFYDSLTARMKRSIPEMLDSLAPLYARRLTASELNGAIRFFESPAGQAFAREQGELSAEGMTIGQRWGARLGVAVAKDLVDAGISLTPSGR
jgi:hypothetical protein